MAGYFITRNEELETEIKDAMRPVMHDLFKIQLKYVKAIAGDDATNDEFDQALRYVSGLLIESLITNSEDIVKEILEEEEPQLTIDSSEVVDDESATERRKRLEELDAEVDALLGR